MFLALCAAEDYEVAMHLVEGQPYWTRDTGDVELAMAFWRWGHYLNRGIRKEQASLAAIIAELKAETAALRDTRAATDDLDVFQAGYERGYAQGWQRWGTVDAKDGADT